MSIQFYAHKKGIFALFLVLMKVFTFKYGFFLIFLTKKVIFL